MNGSVVGVESLERLQRDTFTYFLRQSNPFNGLVADTTEPGAPASIAIVGFALAAYPVGVERGFLTRAEAVARTLATLRFFRDSPQGTGADATGHRVSIITSLTCRPDSVCGRVSCRRLTRHFSLPAC